MLSEKHDQVHELPEHRDTIHKIKMTSTHFPHLFDEYHIVNNEIHCIENGIENTSDDYLEPRFRS
jgi:uncharacterized protein